MTCDWPTRNPLMDKYHDEEWGTPVHDDQLFFEYLCLDAFQAGLSWRTILNKRENFRKAFDQFDVQIVATWDDAKIASLLRDEGIIRNRLKIEATRGNARAFIRIREEFGSFDRYIWNFTDGKTIHNSFEKLSEIPASSPLSDRISKDLKNRGFKFAGTTIIYAFLQASGIVNDHLIQCFRHKQLRENA